MAIIGQIIQSCQKKWAALFAKPKHSDALTPLITSMRNMRKDQFDIINPPVDSTYKELFNTFNSMSSDMLNKIKSLQALSAIDREISTKSDVNHIMQLIIDEIELATLTSCVAVLRRDEYSDGEAEFIASTSKFFTLTTSKVTLSSEEVSFFKSSPQGKLIKSTEASASKFNAIFEHEEQTCYWVYPAFLEGKLRALIVIKKTTASAPDAMALAKIYALSNRVGIAVAAQAREEFLLIQAQYDRLTGLPNRILLHDRLNLAIEHCAYTGNTFWVALIDLDRFKTFNDSLGRKSADALLVEAASRLNDITEDTDTVARIGGDAFIVILQSQKTEHHRMKLLHKIISSNESPMIINDQEVILNASIGVAIYPNDGKSADELINNADLAMYRAKESGRNNFQFYTQSVNKRVIDRLQMEMHLRKAIELDELKLRYQPKISTQTNEIVGMEALISWQSEAFGLVPTQHFIPLAEETGLIISIGEWALKTACAQAAAWKKQGFKNLLVSVNLSARQFQQIGLVEIIAQILKETGLPANCLELELTESLIMSNVDEAMQILNGIKSIGVHLSVDDFGTGYSSLAYLQKLPLETLKIDKSFIDDIKQHTDDVPLVASIISLAQNLNLKTVAEGVESYEQVKYLKSHGCNEIQGFYFSKSLSAEAFENMLKLGIQLS